MAYTGLNSPAHTGKAVTPTTPIPAGQPGGDLAPKAPVNGLAAFANSDMGKVWSQAGAFAPAQMPGYSDAFQGALGAARGNITQMLHGALGDIQTSQGLAQQALGHYAPMVNDAYQAGLGQVNNAATAGADAMSKYGVGSEVSNANLAPERIAVGLTHQNDRNDQALLGTGLQEEAASQRAQANLAAQDRMQQVDMLQANLQAQSAQAAQQQGYTQANNLQQFGLNMLNNAQQTKDRNAAAKTAATSNPNPATGPYAGTSLTQGQVESVQKSPQYASYKTMIGNLSPGSQEASVAAGQIMQATNGSPALQEMLLKDYPDLFATATSVANQGASGGGPNPLAQFAAAPGRGLVNQARDSGTLGRGMKRINSWINPGGWFGG